MLNLKKHPVLTSAIGVVALGGATVLTCAAAATASAGTVPPCVPTQLRAVAGDEQAGMSHREVSYQVTNLSDDACTVKDAPTAVTQTDGVPTTTTVGDTYFGTNPAATVIRLDPGHSATGRIAWSVPQDGASATTANLNVTLPGVGEVQTGATVTGGASGNAYTVTNLQPVS